MFEGIPLTLGLLANDGLYIYMYIYIYIMNHFIYTHSYFPMVYLKNEGAGAPKELTISMRFDNKMGSDYRTLFCGCFFFEGPIGSS